MQCNAATAECSCVGFNCLQDSHMGFVTLAMIGLGRGYRTWMYLSQSFFEFALAASARSNSARMLS